MGGGDSSGAAGSSSSGSAGTTGAAGTAAAAGTTGAAGTVAAAGTTGAAGTSAAAGTTGAAGTSAAAGTTGAAGTTAAAGTTGAAGTGSGAGTTGTAGTTAGGGRGGGAAGTTGGGGTTGTAGTSGGGTFTLTSPHHKDGDKFGTMYTCAMSNGTFGAGLIPELNWAGVPAGTMSFAITFIDTTIGENMSMGQHWAIWNIPWNASTGKVSQIPEGTKALTGDLAAAKQNGNYLAPCAVTVKNNMDDQYEFTIYALSSATLNVTGGTSVASALAALKMVQPLGTAKLHGHAGVKGQ
jgi:phosphatidylethanolamine-binding protein (PEBP) family uncharacterized protein